MKSTIIFSVVLFVAVVAASVFYFTGLGSTQRDSTKPLTFLPEETLLIAAFKNDETTDNIFKDFEVFDAILGFRETQHADSLKQQLLRSPALTAYVAGADVYASFHQVDKKIEMLYTIPTEEALPKGAAASLLASLSSSFQVSSVDTLGHTIYALKSDSAKQALFVAYQAEIIFATSSMPVLTKVLNKRHPKLSKEKITFFLENTNRNVPLSVYFTHQQTDSLAKQFLRNRPQGFMQQFLRLGGQSAWNINYKQDALMLTGESELADTEQNYISLFAHQQKTTQRLYNYFPSNTALYLEYSLSDLRLYRQELEKYIARKPNQKRLQDQLENLRSSRSELMQDFEQAAGNEFALVELNNGNYLGFLSLRDSTTIQSDLSKLGESVGDGQYRLRYENLLYAFYGDAFSNFIRPYFMLVDDVLVFANQSATLSEFKRRWNNSDLLTGTLGFKNYERLQGNEANVTYFMHTKNASRMLGRSLITPYARNFSNTQDYGYQDFYSWSAQLTGNGGNFISSIYGIYKSSSALGASPEWTYAFNNRLITRPYVFEHSDTSQFILAQEQDHTVHAIHPTGSKMWSAVFSGRVVGDMVQGKDRSILLATDRNRLYRFDTSGEGMPGFSLALPAAPTGAPQVVSIAQQEIILVPLNDRIAAYDMQGNVWESWEMDAVRGRLLQGIYYWKGMIVVGSTAGYVYYLGTDGQIQKRIETPEESNFSGQLGMLSRGDRDPEFIATDTSGSVYAFSYTEPVRVMHIPEASKSQQRYFVRLAESGDTEILTVDENVLHVYTISDSLSVRFTHAFTQPIAEVPLLLPNTAEVQRLGIAIPSNNLVYIFGENGSIMDGFPVEALPLFYYGRINYNSANYLLSTKRDHKLYAYRH